MVKLPKSLDDPFKKLDDKILKDIKKEFDKLYEEFKKQSNYFF